MAEKVALTFRPGMNEQPVTHLIYDGNGGWIEARQVWIDMPHPEVDGAESGWGWRFKTAEDCVRWLRG